MEVCWTEEKFLAEKTAHHQRAALLETEEGMDLQETENQESQEETEIETLTTPN